MPSSVVRSRPPLSFDAMRYWAAALCILLTASGCGAAKTEPPLEIGLATRDITPPVGYRLAGYFYERRSTATHDPLHAKAIVFRQGDARFAWVVCDLCQTSPEVVEQARTTASAKTGIPSDDI